MIYSYLFVEVEVPFKIIPIFCTRPCKNACPRQWNDWPFSPYPVPMLFAAAPEQLSTGGGVKATLLRSEVFFRGDFSMARN